MLTCPCCGLAHQVPTVPAGMRACCVRCHSTLRKRSAMLRGNQRAAALSLAALILFPFAIGLPMLRIERFGHHHDAGILDGIATLLATGHVIVGSIVLICSLILPIGKLIAIMAMSLGGGYLRRQHRAWMYHAVEFTGRWGMLDVLLVAMLVAAIKIGDLVQVVPGPAALTFSICVLLSLLAAAAFDPHSLWDNDFPQAGANFMTGDSAPAHTG